MRNEETSPVNWHALDPEEVLKRLETGADGLDEAQAKQRREETGPNALEAEEGAGPWRLLARQVHNPLIYLLIGAAVLSFVIGHRVDAAVILGVVVLNTLLGFIQEWRAEGALAALQEMSAPHSRVLRDGKPRQIEAREVVPGDVLVLETGDRVAADARLLSGDDLQVDESALTGESESVAKAPGQADESASVADQRNMVWMSTNVTGGRGRAIVVATGMDTQIGRIAEQVRSTGRQETPLQKRLKTLGLALGIIGIALAAVVFLLGILRGFGAVQMLLFAVAVAVSAIPEGLPAVISVTLALGVRRMADRHAIVRRLSAVETLGSTTVICSDKTGTITENQMTVRQLWAGGQSFEASGDGYRPEGELKQAGGETVGERPEALERLLRIGALSSNAELKEEDGHWTVEGNSSEGALLAVAIKAGMDIGPMRGEDQRLAEIPFSSAAKYNATLHPDQDGAGRVACVKGAPERILGFCSHVWRDGKPVAIDDGLRREIGEIGERYAAEGLRVMAGADREMPSGQDGLEPSDVENGLTFVGLWGMFDPPPRKANTP